MTTLDEKEAIIRHLQYEWDMLHDTATALTELAPSRTQLRPGVWPALVESFAMHVRNLNGFLCVHKQSHHGDDVIATEFVAGWCETSSTLADAFKKASQQIAHLSYKRIRAWKNPEDFDWNVNDLAAEVDRLMQKLTSAAARDPNSPIRTLQSPQARAATKPQPPATSVDPPPAAKDLGVTIASTPTGTTRGAYSRPDPNFCARTAPDLWTEIRPD